MRVRRLLNRVPRYSPSLLVGALTSVLLGVGMSPAPGALGEGVGHVSTLGHVTAVASRVISVHDTAGLRLASHQGTQVLNERGTASGTLRGPLTIVIDLAGSSATVTFTVDASGGSISGKGQEAYHVSGSTGYLNGSLVVTHGTGRYAHASGLGLRLSGKIERHSYAVAVEVTGRLRY